MIVESILQPMAWDFGYASVTKSITADNKQIMEAAITLALPGETLNTASFKGVASLQHRSRDFLKQALRLDRELVEAGMLDQLGWHEEVYNQLRDKMIQQQANNSTWQSKFMRFGCGRLRRSYVAGRKSKAPLITGFIAGYDPGTRMLGVSVGPFTQVCTLDNSLSEAQERKNIISAGYVKERQYTISDEDQLYYQGLADELNAKLQAHRAAMNPGPF